MACSEAWHEKSPHDQSSGSHVGSEVSQCQVMRDLSVWTPVPHLYNDRTGSQQCLSNWPMEPGGSSKGTQGVLGSRGGRECLRAPTSASVRIAL